MAYGLTIYNDNNEIQVDGTYKNFSLHDSGSWSVSSGFGWYNFSATTKPPILAIRPPGTFCLAAQYQRNASLEYYTTKIYADGSITLPYIVFTEAAISEIPSGAYGLAVYNEYGNLVFHNYNKWCRLISSITTTNPLHSDCSGNPGDSVDVTVEDADNNYFILRPLCEKSEWNESLFTVDYMTPLMKKINSTTIRVSVFITQRISGEHPLYCYSSSNLTLTEVNV